MKYSVIRRSKSEVVPYPCGLQQSAEDAVIYFNSKYGPRLSVTLTTQEVGELDPVYVLQELREEGERGLHLLRPIALYRR
jgi:hypothetical protein